MTHQRRNLVFLVVSLLLIVGAAALGIYMKNGGYAPLPAASSSGGEDETSHPTIPPSAPPKADSENNQDESMPEASGIFSDYYANAKQKAAGMTIEEKVGQVFLARYPGEGAKTQITANHPGGFVLFAKDFKNKSKTTVKNELKDCQSASNIPLILGVDEEGGTVVRVSSNTALSPRRFLSPQTLFQQGGLAGIREDTRQKSQLLLELGLNLNLAPVADVSTDRNDFIHSRTFGMGAQATSEYIQQVVREMNKENLSGALKHFPGYGNNSDTHTGLARDTRPYSDFVSNDFLPFSAGISEGVPCVLVSHVIVECMDAQHPASLSPKVHRILREDLGFTGVILTDDLAMDAIADYSGGENPAVSAFLAGNDMLLCSDLETSYQALLEAVRSGQISQNRLDQSVIRILSWKYSKGILS